MIASRLQNLSRLVPLAAAAFVLQGCIFSASAQLLVRPKASEFQEIEKALDPALLPSGARQLVVETSQMFRLVQKESPAIIIVPVHFRTQSPIPSHTISHNCGVYLLPAGGKPTFQLLVSESLVPDEECFGGVEAVGAHISPGQLKANPIFIYRAKTAGGIEYRPKILRWSFDADAYIYNPEGSHYLLEQGHIPTSIQEVLDLWAHTKSR